MQKKYLYFIDIGNCQFAVFHLLDGTDGIGKPLDGFDVPLDNRYVQVSTLVQGDMLQRSNHFPVYIVSVHYLIQRFTLMVFGQESDNAYDLVLMAPIPVPEFSTDQLANNFRAV
jgi:hypothetical protein